MSQTRLKANSRESMSVLHQVATLKCNKEHAFEMFTVNRLIEPWLIHPFGGSHAEVESVLGGKYELFWDKNSRETNSTLGCRITALVKDRLLCFDWKGPPEFKAFMNVDPLTHVTVAFFPSSERGSLGTDVHLIHTGWGSTSEWQSARDWFVKAWAGSFKILEKMINEP